jgi:hypothetical protein
VEAGPVRGRPAARGDGAGGRDDVDPSARRRRPHADAQADAAAVPRRGDRPLRRPDRTARPRRDRGLAAPGDRADPAARAADHDGGDHPRRLRDHRPRARRRAQAAAAAALLSQPADPAAAQRLRSRPVGEVHPRPRPHRRDALRRDREPARQRRGRPRRHPVAAAVGARRGRRRP